MRERDHARLRCIRDSIFLVEEYTSGGLDVFLREPMAQDAVLRRIETLADATGKLPESLKARQPQMPWRLIYGFRNVAAHAYETIDLERVWEIVTAHLAPLKAVVLAELPEDDVSTPM